MAASGLVTIACRICSKMHTVEASPSARRRNVLVVEDDAVNRTFLRLTLEKSGYQALPAPDVKGAQKEFQNRGAAYFDCVISDYWLPDGTGLEFLSWLKTQDPSLATIILTADGERNLLTESLRLGAADFLEKPVNVPKLMVALEKASAQTTHNRHLSASDSAVKNLGRTQRWMMRAVEHELVDLFFHPKFEAGGDFLARFQITPQTQCCLLTDVSGHDPQAAYISAYFHGVFRGMLLREAPLTSIFSYFNDFLTKEWNQEEKLHTINASSTSVAAMALYFDADQQTASVLNSGAPVPVYVAPDGRAQWLGENGGPPLGWFRDMDLCSNIHSLTGGGTIYLWTDGLADLAEKEGFDPLAMAFALQQAKANAPKFPLLDRAQDDVLFAAVHLPYGNVEIGLLQPLILETYCGNREYEIDTIEAGWRRSLKLALPHLSEAQEHDILLAGREAVINALQHGCRGDEKKLVRFQASYHRLHRFLRVWVEDPGEGHEFDLAAHKNILAEDLIDQHRGLLYITNLARAVHFERNGATVIMDFQL